MANDQQKRIQFLEKEIKMRQLQVSSLFHLLEKKMQIVKYQNDLRITAEKMRQIVANQECPVIADYKELKTAAIRAEQTALDTQRIINAMQDYINQLLNEIEMLEDALERQKHVYQALQNKQA